MSDYLLALRTTKLDSALNLIGTLTTHILMIFAEKAVNMYQSAVKVRTNKCCVTQPVSFHNIILYNHAIVSSLAEHNYPKILTSMLSPFFTASSTSRSAISSEQPVF